MQTTVKGTITDLETASPLQVSSCGAALQLAAGQHRLTSGPDGGLVLTTAALTPAQVPPVPAARAVSINGTWGPESRDVFVGPGAASYLALTENFNPGWTATLDGHRLQAVRLDGWRQAWVVPAGLSGDVHLSYPPGHQYIWILVAGIAGIVLLLELAWWPGRPRPTSPSRRDDVFLSASRIPYGIQVAFSVAVSFALGGALGILICALLLMVRRSHLPGVAGGAFAVAGIAVFLSPGRFPGSNSGAFGAPAQLLAMVAVVAVIVSLIRVRGET
ncbi:MAG: hypothetical protein JOZ41_01050 [Chloroflexi bacterium]|nr:hypothetical protein [Chloroflexota bacterium]